jgi:hypothetical protein
MRRAAGMVDFVEPFDRLRAGYGHPILAAL